MCFCCRCPSLPLTHLAGFVLVIVSVPAADAIPALLVLFVLCNFAVAGVLYRIVDGIPTVLL
jgi:hypothetical protein